MTNGSNDKHGGGEQEPCCVSKVESIDKIFLVSRFEDFVHETRNQVHDWALIGFFAFLDLIFFFEILKPQNYRTFLVGGSLGFDLSICFCAALTTSSMSASSSESKSKTANLIDNRLIDQLILQQQ